MIGTLRSPIAARDLILVETDYDLCRRIQEIEGTSLPWRKRWSSKGIAEIGGSIRRIVNQMVERNLAVQEGTTESSSVEIIDDRVLGVVRRKRDGGSR